MSLWVPREPSRKEWVVSVDRVTRTYGDWLSVVRPAHFGEFQKRLIDNPAGAQAEAVVFAWLRLLQHDPDVFEELGVGGPDFICTPRGGGEKFLIEVTALDAEAVSAKSGWPNEFDDVARPFTLITDVFNARTKRKAPQLGGQEFPGVLAVCLSHVGAAALVSTFAAKLFSIDPAKAPFFRKTAAGFETVRKSVSAILLIAIWDDQLDAIGLLHPEPARPFEISGFYDVPFFRLIWPPAGEEVKGEWVTYSPPGSKAYHAPINLTDDELKGSKSE